MGEDLARESTDQSIVDLSRDFGAYVAARVGDFDTAVRLGLEPLAGARLGGDRYVVIDLLNRIAEDLMELGRLDEAEEMMDEAMEIARTTPIGPLAAKVIQVQAAVDIEHGRLSAAIGAALEALRLTATLYPDPVTQASVLRILAAAWCAAGDLDAAPRDAMAPADRNPPRRRRAGGVHLIRSDRSPSRAPPTGWPCRVGGADRGDGPHDRRRPAPRPINPLIGSTRTPSFGHVPDVVFIAVRTKAPGRALSTVESFGAEDSWSLLNAAPTVWWSRRRPARSCS